MGRRLECDADRSAQRAEARREAYEEPPKPKREIITRHAASLCWEQHDVPEGEACPVCADHERFANEAAYAQRLYQMADTTRGYAPAMADPEDGAALMEWAAHLEKTAREINGRLGREADRRENEETTSGYMGVAWR